MNSSQISRPMQILLALVVVLAIAYFTVLKPGGGEEIVEPPVAAAPTTPAADAGGAAAQTGVGQIVETAQNAGADANAAVAAREGQTGEEAPTTGAPAATTPGAPAGTTPGAAGTKQSAKEIRRARADRKLKKDAAEMVRSIQNGQKNGRVAVILVAAKGGVEDERTAKRVKDLPKRRTKVQVYRIPVNKIAAYEAIVGNLALAQTPSLVIVAPDGTSKVLGGYVATERILRLIDSAGQIKPIEQPAAAGATP